MEFSPIKYRSVATESEIAIGSFCVLMIVIDEEILYIGDSLDLSRLSLSYIII